MIRLSLRRVSLLDCSSPLSLKVNSSTNADINLEKLENESIASDKAITEDLEQKQREEQIEKSRNKSRLSPPHRNILNELNPYPEPKIWIHGTVKYLRKTYGKYGSASGVNPAICWPLKEELDDKKEYEKVAFPHTIPQMIEIVQKQKQEDNEKLMMRQKEILERMGKLEQWKKDLHNRITKKENEVKAAKEKRERLIEEVRRHFGYTVDPRDAKFQEMLEKKEKEQKKALKEAKRKAKEEKFQEELKTKKEALLKKGQKEEDKSQKVDE